MRAAQIDTTQAQDKSERELLEKVYSALVTPDPTPLDPNPAPRALERIENMDNRLEALEQQMVTRTFEGDVTAGGHLSGTVTSPHEDPAGS